MKSFVCIAIVVMVIAVWTTVNVNAADNFVAIDSPERDRTYEAKKNIPVSFKAGCAIEKPSRLEFFVQQIGVGPIYSSTVWFHQNVSMQYDVRIEPNRDGYNLRVKAICGDGSVAYGHVRFMVRP